MVPIVLVVAMVAIAAAATVATVSSIQASQAAAKNAQMNSKLGNQEAVAQAQVAERQARQSENAVQQEQQALSFDLRNEQRRIDALLSQQRQVIGASGVELTGSPLLVTVETAREEALQLEAMRWESQQRSQALGDEAQLSRFQANELRSRGVAQLQIGQFRSRTLKQAGRMQAAGTALQGVASAASVGASGMGGA